MNEQEVDLLYILAEQGPVAPLWVHSTFYKGRIDRIVGRQEMGRDMGSEATCCQASKPTLYAPGPQEGSFLSVPYISFCLASLLRRHLSWEYMCTCMCNTPLPDLFVHVV